MQVWTATDTRQVLHNYIQSQPQKGRGVLARLARELNVHSTLLSLILSGKRDLSYEQAWDLTRSLDLTEDEADYFMLLLQKERAGTPRLKTRINQKLEQLKQKQSAVQSQLSAKKILSETDQARFYSHWEYSAVRLFCSTNTKGRTVEELCEFFQLGRSRVMNILQFLLSTGLVVLEKSRYRLGDQRTYVGPGSPFLLQHHVNWRLKSLEKVSQITADELMVTSPFSISKEDFQVIKNKLLDFVKASAKVIENSPAEDLACFNLDLFWIQSKAKDNK